MLKYMLPSLLLATIACSSGQQAAEAPQPDAVETPAEAVSEETAEPAPAVRAEAVSVKQKTDFLEFSYAYPRQASAIAPLKSYLDGDMDDNRRRATASAREEKSAAAGGGFPFLAHTFEKEWQVVTDTPRFLSLSANAYFYTGGAHGMTAFYSLLWDKTDNRRLAPLNVFVRPAAFNDALRDDFCAALDRERAEKREGYDELNEYGFSDCLVPSDQTVILGSTDGRAIDRVGFLIGPYEAGPYAEGSYEVTLPVNRAILAAVKPTYRDAFAVR